MEFYLKSVVVSVRKRLIWNHVIGTSRRGIYEYTTIAIVPNQMYEYVGNTQWDRDADLKNILANEEPMGDFYCDEVRFRRMPDWRGGDTAKNPMPIHFETFWFFHSC